jgi:hypothetical protein
MNVPKPLDFYQRPQLSVGLDLDETLLHSKDLKRIRDGIKACVNRL